jgi:beta-galactosidase
LKLLITSKFLHFNPDRWQNLIPQIRAKTLATGKLELPHVPAGRSAEICLPTILFQQKTHPTYLTVTLEQREKVEWDQDSYAVAWTQALISKPTEKALVNGVSLSQGIKNDISTNSTKTTVSVSGANWSFQFDRLRGHLKQWTHSSTSILEPHRDTGLAMIPGFWRPPTDNDVPSTAPYWKRFGVNSLTNQLRSLDVSSAGDGSVCIESETFLSPPVLSWGWKCLARYIIKPNGSLTITIKLQPTGTAPKTVPRVGLDLHATSTLQSARWLGLGPGESYPDKKAAQRFGLWDVEDIASLQTVYDIPQENGNRTDTAWIELVNSSGIGFRAAPLDSTVVDGGASSLNWTASRFSDQTVEAARHPCDLVQEDAVMVRLDYQVAGVGTAACGPGPLEEHLVKVKDFTFGMLLEPISS